MEDGQRGNNNPLHTSGFHSNLNISQQMEHSAVKKSGLHGENNDTNIIHDDDEKEHLEQLRMLNNNSEDVAQYLIYSSRSLKYKSSINSAVIKSFAS